MREMTDLKVSSSSSKRQSEEGSRGSEKVLKIPAPDDARGNVEYIIQSECRPVGLPTLIDKTNGRFDKGVIQANLDQLERRNSVKSKMAGNVKLWWPASMRAYSASELEAWTSEAREANARVQRLEKEAAQLKRRVNELSREPTTADLDAAIDRATAQVQELESKRARIAGHKVDKRAMVAAAKRHNAMRKTWVSRKRAYKDCLDTLADAMDAKPKTLLKDIEDAASYETHPRDDSPPPAVAVPK